MPSLFITILYISSVHATAPHLHHCCIWEGLSISLFHFSLSPLNVICRLIDEVLLS